MATYASKLADLHLAMVNDDRNGYSQWPYRWGEDGHVVTYGGATMRTGSYDCSSSVIAACQALGIPVGGASYTGNMEAGLTSQGAFVAFPYSYGSLVRGDIILNPGRHVTVYQGGGKMSTFDINENGGAYNGATGDQTGREACVRAVYNFGQTRILRCVMPTAGESIDLDVRNGAVLRLYNRWTGEHLFTTDAKEARGLIDTGWSYENAAWMEPDEGVAIYRLYNRYSGDHAYSTDLEEIVEMTAQGWVNEGVKLLGGDGAPVYRLFNPNAETGTHHYTTGERERDALVNLGWRYEGVAWRAA